MTALLRNFADRERPIDCLIGVVNIRAVAGNGHTTAFLTRISLRAMRQHHRTGRGRLGIHEVEVHPFARTPEQPFPTSKDQGVDHQAELVDQSVLDEGLNEAAATENGNVAARLLLQAVPEAALRVLIGGASACI
jgi:hypothetical protein